MRSTFAVVAALAVGIATLTAGCGGDPVTKQYVFHTSDSPINVDTPQLRKLKERAGIEPCPATSAASSAASSAADHLLPDITLPCLGGGRAVNLADLRGPLVVNVWAQWCGPCRAETALLAKVADDYRGSVGVLGIDWQDTKPDYALGMLLENKATYPQLADPEAATRAPLQIRGLPVTLFVARDGSVAYVNNGPFANADDLQTAIEEHLGVSAPGGGT